MRKLTFQIVIPTVLCVSICAVTAPVGGQAQTNPASSQPVRQSIRGTVYENETAHFTLAVPKDWVVFETLMKQLPGLVGALSGPGASEAIMVQRYYVPGPKEGAAYLETQFSKTFKDYRKVSEGPMKIDGEDAYSFSLHTLFPFGPPEKPTLIPVRLVVVLIPDGESVLGFTCQAPESAFGEAEPILNKIVTSFHRNPQ
jgi:hypothetical protein